MRHFCARAALILRNIVVCFCGLSIAACTGDAVVFAPTPAPPDVSPLVYQHPGGVFSVTLPRNWSVNVTHTTALAAASFSPPEATAPLLSIAVINLGEDLTVDSFGAVIEQYQTQIRPDLATYTEQDRTAMGDGSWRMTGVRQTPGGEAQAVNTFIERAGTLLGVVEVVLPLSNQTAPALDLSTLQGLVNTVTLNADAALEPGGPSLLAGRRATTLSVASVSQWSTPAGVFFITGEVTNTGSTPLSDIPVRAQLVTADGLVVAEANDMVMGWGLAPGAFAPFSLRFGQGKPADAARYTLEIGSADWQHELARGVAGSEVLTWTDDSQLMDDGRLIITGTATNSGDDPIPRPRAVATVFDADQQIIAAAFTDLQPDLLEPGASADFQITVPEIGGDPDSYIVIVQGLR